MKVSYYTILHKAKQRQVSCCKIGSRVLFSLEGLTAWVEDQEAASVQPQDDNQGYG